MSGKPKHPAPAAVGLVEDDRPYHDYVGSLLKASGRYTLAGAAGTAAEALAWPATLRPVVLLLDVSLPGRSGPAAVADFLARWPGVKVVMLTGRDEDEPLLAAIRAGASGYLLKSASSAEIVEALDDALAGGAPMSPGIAKRVFALLREPPAARTGDGALAQLSARESEVLALVAEGCADKEICARLGVTRSTVKNHLTAIYDKWRVRSRTQAALRFVKVTGR